MADEANKDALGSIPPKLDLRKSGILKSTPPPAVPAAPVAPAAMPAEEAREEAPTLVPTATPVPPAAPAPAVRAIPRPAAPAAAAPAPGTPRPNMFTSPRPAGTATVAAPTVKPAGPAVQAWRPGSGQSPKPAEPTGAAAAPGAAPVAPAPAGTPAAPAPVVATAAAPVVVPAPTVKPAGKKDTSKIPLEAAKPRVDKPVAAPATGVPTTEGAPSTLQITRPGETAQIAGPSAAGGGNAEKRRTSRISLDSVLGESPAAEGAGPKTIRLKRPGETGGPKVTGDGGAAPAAAEPAAGAGPTQRKTVVVKRTPEPAARKLNVARPAAGAGAPAAETAPTLAAPPTVREPHLAYGLVACAATLVLFVVIYLFAAQAIGPNSSMMQYSSWVGGPNLVWPGKLAFNN